MNTKDNQDNNRITLILRNNPGIIRDCWIEEDKANPENEVLVIRQIRDNGAEGTYNIKSIRLLGSEIVALRNMLNIFSKTEEKE